MSETIAGVVAAQVVDTPTEERKHPPAAAPHGPKPATPRPSSAASPAGDTVHISSAAQAAAKAAALEAPPQAPAAEQVRARERART
jgi:hypothetical protein